MAALLAYGVGQKVHYLSTRTDDTSHTRNTLEKAGMDQSKYCGHSFRFGAAITAAEQDIEDA